MIINLSKNIFKILVNDDKESLFSEVVDLKGLNKI